jgi:mannosyl-oligosaccharide alpha-1,2-mannosidase
MGNLELNYKAGEGHLGGEVTSVPWSQTEVGRQRPMPMPETDRPLTHKEYVEDRIKNERIPEGYVRVMHRQYILR